MNNFNQNSNSIIDTRNDKLDNKKLKNILKLVEEDNRYGDIIWSDNLPNDTKDQKLIESIETKLKKNNETFSRYPNDFTHCLISFDVYKNEHKTNEALNKNKDWKVLQVFNEVEGVVGKATNGNKVQIYYGVIYVNHYKKQMVLCHKGIDADFASVFNKNGQLANNFEGVLMNKVVPQLAICYEVTKKANELAKEKNYYLSFTGYSNGAWLAEYSNLYSYCEFDNKKTKAVLFESPGILKREEEIQSANIYSKETRINLDNLNIVNYLLAPNLANSCNRHVGKVFRLFIDEDKKVNEVLESLKKVPLIGKEIVEKLKSSRFFLEGLNSMFNHRNLKRLLETFDQITGEPKEFEKVLKWPIVNLSISKDYQDNFKKLIENPIKKGIDLIPVPIFIKKPVELISNFLVPKLINNLAEKTIPGLHILINITIELLSGNIDMQNFESKDFYKKRKDNNKNNKDNNAEAELKNKEFELKFIKSYDTKEANLKEEELDINVSNKNIDWCLDCLKSYDLNSNNLSKIVYFHLNELKLEYEIETVAKHDIKETKIIKTKKITIENLKERLIRLIHLNPNIRDLISEAAKLKIEDLTEICHEFENETETTFIGRDDEIKKIEEILANKNSVIISAFAGTGKTRLAKQLGHLYQSKNEVVVRWFNCEKLDTFEEEFKRFAKLLLKTEFIGDDLSLVIQKVNIKMKSHKKKFLFIFDNVEQYKEINKKKGLYPQNVLLNMPKNKYLVIITSRISSLTNEFETVTIKPFKMIDAKNYLMKNSKENITDLELQNLFKFFNINNSKENDEILPIKLFLVVKNINGCINLNKLLQN